MRLFRDRSALESIPLRLMIVAVVAALSVAPAAEALRSLQDREFLKEARAQLELVVACAEVVSVQGPGGARTMSLDFSSGSDIGFVRFALGDHLGGPAAACAILELTSGSSMMADSDLPGMWVCGSGGEPFESTCAVFVLRLNAVLREGGVCVIAEDVAWTS